MTGRGKMHGVRSISGVVNCKQDGNGMEIALIDDEKTVSDLISEYLTRYEAEHPEAGAFRLTAYVSAHDFLAAYQWQFDLILMDIELDDLSGMEAARLLRKKDPEVLLFFLTNLAQYAVEGYEVDAADFMVKPVSYEAFSFKLEKALRLRAKRGGRQLRLQSGARSVRVSSETILYVEVRNHDLIYHLGAGGAKKEDISLRATLKSAEETLEGLPFAKCNSCYLVNLREVYAVDGFTLTLTDESTLQISRNRRAGFLQEYTRFLGGIGGN